MYGNRVNQLDLRIAKNLRFGGTRTMLSVDLYNALNTGAILTYNNDLRAAHGDQLPASTSSRRRWRRR